MTRSLNRNRWTWAVLLAGVAVAPALAQPKAPPVKATLHTEAATIAPGTPFDVALRFEVPAGYHLYWENPGESGMPPQVKWKLPAGFSAGPLRFPPPKRHEAAGIVTYVLEGAPTLLATLTPPADLPVGGPVELAADLRWLVCKKACYLGKKSVSLTLATGASAVTTENEDDALLFRLARRALPVATAKAKDITLTPSATQGEIAVGDAFDIVLEVAVKRGFHTQSNKPLGEFFVPAAVFPRKVSGLEFGRPIWPKPHLREDKVFGKVSEFAGNFKVRVPVKMTEPTATAEVPVSGVFTYQACNDRGQCHPPESVEWAVRLASSDIAEATPQPESKDEPGIADAGDGSDACDRSDDDAGKADNAAPIGDDGAPTPASGGLASLGIWGAIIGGFLGGLILNIMPCVLPVISIKILSFVQQADEEPRRVFHLGLTFAAGIVVSFLIIAVAILWLQSVTDTAQSWGTLFQRPAFVAGMLVVMFAFALNLFGVFEIILPGAAAGKLAAATEREGFSGAFMKGVLATLLATPCTAPFLASAVSFALASSVVVTLMIFTAAGVGMAFPYVLLTARPAWMKYMPKPGNWMVAFKQFMGFLLIGTAVWLLWVLGKLRGEPAVVWMVAFLAFLALACWLFGRVQPGWQSSGKLAAYGSALAVVLLGGWFAHGMYVGVPEVEWVAYEPGLAKRYAAEGRTVYVDYTAAWCLTCQANKKVVFTSDKVLKRFDDYEVIPIKADYTNYDPQMAEDLKAFNRDAVPLNVIYPAGKPGSPILLPVVLTPGRVLDALEQAGASTAESPPARTASAAS
jgi:thiol:disulfide interchange protein